MTFFCPRCLREIKRDDKRCPHCSTAITKHEKKGFEEKLINALNHPERETVQRAVWILGQLKSIKAVQPIIKLFEQTDNPYIKVEILHALDQIGTAESRSFVIRSLDSEIAIVRRKAKELTERKIK